MSGLFAVAASRKPMVVVADDNPIMLQTVTGVLSPDFDVVAAVGDGEAALDMAARTKPALVVLDISMPKLDGFRTARELAQRKSSSKIVFLTAQEDDDFVAEALKIGIHGYVVKRRLRSDLPLALKLALGGQLFISPYAFAGTPRYENDKHFLEFYSEERKFFQQVAERTCTALANGELVFTLLSEIGLYFVRERMRVQGLDYMAAIRRQQYWAFSVENVLASPVTDSSPDTSLFNTLVRACLNRAISRSQETGFKLTVISDLMATLLRRGCCYEAAARVEAVWNDIVPIHSCIVYCGCPVMHLGANKSRETLSKICGQHDNVIPING